MDRNLQQGYVLETVQEDDKEGEVNNELLKMS